MNTDLVHSIHDVPAGEWDRLARQTSLYLSHRWLAGEEQDPTATASYVLVRDREGAILAATPLYEVHEEPNDNYRTDTVLSSPASPRVIAGARRGYHNSPLTAPGLTADQRAACLTLLRDAARAHAGRLGTTHWWPYLTRAAADALAPLYRERPRHQQDDATIPLPGHGFDDYVASLPAKRRAGVRSERRAFAESGLDLRIQPLGDCYQDAGSLLAGHQKSHGHARDSTGVMTELLKRQAEAMGDTARVAAAYDQDRMIGFCLSYHYGATTWIRAVAADKEHPAPYAYFNLAYYLPIEDAYAHKTTALHAGMKSIEAKRLRGAEVSSLYALHDVP
ncbi:GNAT family N-acetyltransferase [Streptomyces armeniacus]|uniref:GNAT family N-acetyltransferase n=1 Tax=Streptomyces armeniacus TaxID=83291 RepID=UPI001AD7FDF3|nr:GNAT family N-acetyltransferase [Streptomyces armeniacus]